MRSQDKTEKRKLDKCFSSSPPVATGAFISPALLLYLGENLQLEVGRVCSDVCIRRYEGPCPGCRVASVIVCVDVGLSCRSVCSRTYILVTPGWQFITGNTVRHTLHFSCQPGALGSNISAWVGCVLYVGNLLETGLSVRVREVSSPGLAAGVHPWLQNAAAVVLRLGAGWPSSPAHLTSSFHFVTSECAEDSQTWPLILDPLSCCPQDTSSQVPQRDLRLIRALWDNPLPTLLPPSCWSPSRQV